jgi:hypothetical protein
MKLASLIGVLLLAFVFGCGPSVKEGTKIDIEKMREIYKGYTTSDEVVAKLGKPTEIKRMPTGEEKYIYKYNEEEYIHWWTLPRLEKQELEVTIKDGVVQNYVAYRTIRDKPLREDK